MQAVQETPLESYIFKGLPFVGKPFDRKEKDPDANQPVLNHKAKTKIFHLDKPEDLDEYTAIWNKVCKGEAMIGAEDRQYDSLTKNWIVFVRWAEMFYTNPRGPNEQ
jgi:hypothetical protein